MTYEYDPMSLPQASPPANIPQPTPTRTNGFAVAAMVLGLIGFSLLAVIFGHVALGQIKRDHNQSGRGMAVAGVVLGYVGMALYIIVIIAVASAASDYPCSGYSGCYE